MHRSRLGALVIDCQGGDLAAHGEFWSRALGYERETTSEAWAERYVNLAVPGDQARVLVQRVEHAPRVHIDIETDDIAAEVARLEGLGATVVDVRARWTVMQAPTGHRFCVVHPQRRDFAGAPDVRVWR
ncbi:hypothetical protein OOT46_10920 [Aquabacterium sp. A7-Y]|uniref:VOC family protein n=1 Tax=Aquabacterium sp. A7-Y TaxID=1349605 RepID=UPI00223D7165|nr:VOC family protein [Aquabacterium sp. A7-Y]MCW7538351.1 hypothetical protein [Aquabacterium sp. A7-Y]